MELARAIPTSEPWKSTNVAVRAILLSETEVRMKRALMAASAIAMLAGAQAFAQTVVAPAETVVIEPEQRTLVKEYVVKEKVAPVTVKERRSRSV